MIIAPEAPRPLLLKSALVMDFSNWEGKSDRPKIILDSDLCKRIPVAFKQEVVVSLSHSSKSREQSRMPFQFKFSLT